MRDYEKEIFNDIKACIKINFSEPRISFWKLKTNSKFQRNFSIFKKLLNGKSFNY